MVGFNIISYLSSSLGIGVTARNVMRLVLERGFPVSVLDLNPGLGRYKHDRTYDAYCVRSAAELPHGINLFVLPPPAVAAALSASASQFLRPDRVNAAFTMWELTVLPPAWKTALERLDVVAAESDFIRYAFDFLLSGVLTMTADHPLHLPEDIGPCRTRLGLPKGVLFMTSFDPNSDMERKNPVAAIRAFREYLGDEADAWLFVKVNDPRPRGPDPEVMRELAEAAAGHGRIRFITERMAYADVLRLCASCDVYVSLHRSEGLGLGMMEAMALGKPVVATAWSGNMTFMNHLNSCPVRCRLVPTRGRTPAYGPEVAVLGAVWAEPSVTEAGAWMRLLHGDPGLRQAIGRKAAEDMAARRERAARGLFLDELLALLERRSRLGRITD